MWLFIKDFSAEFVQNLKNKKLMQNLCRILSDSFFDLFFCRINLAELSKFALEMCRNYSIGWIQKENIIFHIIMQPIFVTFYRIIFCKIKFWRLFHVFCAEKTFVFKKKIQIYIRILHFFVLQFSAKLSSAEYWKSYSAEFCTKFS